jgi:tyrosyl-tRNA synthetase
MNLYEELEARGLIFQCTAPEDLQKRLSEGQITIYIGFDPTADSLHIGNLVSLLTLARFQRAGHHVIAVAGGATGMIGDPSGKSEERSFLSDATLANNVACVKQELARFLDFSGERPARLVDNADWTKPVSFLTFLRDVGKSFSINDMLRKDSVRSRLEEREQGISYTEFSYMLLQAFDYAHLFETYHCELQAGGSDQWGNITAGIELIRKRHQKQVFGLTTPLVTDSQGKKFGKSEKGALFLSAHKTSPYQFYQFWIRTLDADVIRYLKIFTFLPLDEISALEQEVKNNPSQRAAQKRLATEMTKLVHGEKELESVQRATEAMFGDPEALKTLSAGAMRDIAEEINDEQGGKGPALPIANLEGAGISLVELLVRYNLFPSRGQAREGIKGGGVYVNNRKEIDINKNISTTDLLQGRYVLLRKGKKERRMLYAILEDESVELTAEAQALLESPQK